jgi:uncharacterized protein YjdB
MILDLRDCLLIVLALVAILGVLLPDKYVSSFTFEGTSMNLVVGQSVGFVLKALNSAGKPGANVSGPVSISISDPTIATVDKTTANPGDVVTVTGIAGGSASLTAALGDVTGSVSLSVSAGDAASFEFDPVAS